MSINTNNLCQIEIYVRDVESALRFYAQAFGWLETPAELHEYKVLQVPDDSKFGIALVPLKHRKKIEREAPRVVLYFKVEKPSDVVSRVCENGGRLVFGPKKLPSYGEIWQVEDLDGNRFGLFHRP